MLSAINSKAQPWAKLTHEQLGQPVVLLFGIVHCLWMQPTCWMSACLLLHNTIIVPGAGLARHPLLKMQCTEVITKLQLDPQTKINHQSETLLNMVTDAQSRVERHIIDPLLPSRWEVHPSFMRFIERLPEVIIRQRFSGPERRVFY